MNNEYIAPVASAHQMKNDALEIAERVINQMYGDYYEFLTPKAKEDINEALFKIDEAQKA